MGKQAINRKEVRKQIAEYRNAGNSDLEIYNQLITNYFDKKTVALLVKGTATNENIKKYQVYNKILVVAYIIAGLICIIEMTMLKLNLSSELNIPLMIIAPVSYLYLAYEINRYDASVYKVGMALAFLYFVISLRNGSGEIILTNAILFSVILILSLFLMPGLFPKYNYGKLQKDESGNYVID